MNGKIVAGGIVVISALAGVAMYYLQVYAFYQPVSVNDGFAIRLTPIGAGPPGASVAEAIVPEAIVIENFQGIDADSSPLRFRGCFTTPLSLGTLTETYQIHDAADPLIAPGWFDCFDAKAIGAALKSGEAVAFLSEADINSKVDPSTGALSPSGVDRVVAVFPDGRAYVWHQLNDRLKD